MTHNEEREACTRKCWWMAGGIGLVLALLLWVGSGWSFWQSLFTGIVIAIIAGALLGYFLCARSVAAQTGATQPQRSNVATTSTGKDTSGRVADQALEPDTSATQSAETSVAPASAPVAASSEPARVFKTQPTKRLPGQDELAARKGTWKYEGATAEQAGGVPVAKQAPAHQAGAANEPAAPEPVTKPASGRKARGEGAKGAAKPKAAERGADSKPELLTAPREGSRDNLKLISGVGPKLELALNEMGVWHFDQVAGWRKKEIEWVDARLPFKGRIERDGWVAQAKTLAKGGEAETSRRKKKT